MLNRRDVNYQLDRLRAWWDNLKSGSWYFWKRSIFGSDVAEWTFLEKDDEYSESELLKDCRGLNVRISHLSGHLIRAWNPRRGPRQLSSDESRADTPDGASKDDAIAVLVRQVLGERLSQELIKANEGEGGSTAIDGILQDGLDAWSVSCIHMAMERMLFGMKVRTKAEINAMRERMNEDEPELAECWKRIREENKLDKRDVDQSIKDFVKSIGSLSLGTEGETDSSEYEILEGIPTKILQDRTSPPRRSFQFLPRCMSWLRILQDRTSPPRRSFQFLPRCMSWLRILRGWTNPPRYEFQVLLHWRALLHKHELGLPSYSEAKEETANILRKGLLQVFVMAGQDPPAISEDANLREMTDKVVEGAATLAKRIKTTIFSQDIRVIAVKPEERYKKEIMTSADDMDEGNVKCTTQFGLHAIANYSANPRILLKTEVLLT